MTFCTRQRGASNLQIFVEVRTKWLQCYIYNTYVFGYGKNEGNFSVVNLGGQQTYQQAGGYETVAVGHSHT